MSKYEHTPDCRHSYHHRLSPIALPGMIAHTNAMPATHAAMHGANRRPGRAAAVRKATMAGASPPTANTISRMMDPHHVPQVTPAKPSSPGDALRVSTIA